MEETVTPRTSLSSVLRQPAKLYSKEEEAWNFPTSQSLRGRSGLEFFQVPGEARSQKYEEIWRNYEGYMKKYEVNMKDIWRKKVLYTSIEGEFSEFYQHFPECDVIREGGSLEIFIGYPFLF